MGLPRLDDRREIDVGLRLLAAAIRKGLAVEALYEVTAIERLASGSPSRYRIEAIDHRVGRRRDFLADHVLLAAGTLNTLRLLLHSRDAGQAHRYATARLSLRRQRRFPGYWNLDDRTRDLTRGLPVHGLLRMKEPDPLGAGRAWPMIADTAAPSPEGMPLPTWLKHKMIHGSLIVGMGPDTQDGVVRCRHGRMRIEYDPTRSAIFGDLIDAYAMISAATGKRIRHFQRPLTVHPTGGACSGANRRERCGRFERRGLRPRRPLRRRRGRAARSRGQPAGDDGRRMGAACGRPLHRAIHALRVTVFSTG